MLAFAPVSRDCAADRNTMERVAAEGSRAPDLARTVHGWTPDRLDERERVNARKCEPQAAVRGRRTRSGVLAGACPIHAMRDDVGAVNGWRECVACPGCCTWVVVHV